MLQGVEKREEGLKEIRTLAVSGRVYYMRFFQEPTDGELLLKDIFFSSMNSNLILFQNWTVENIPAKPVILLDIAGVLGNECKQVSTKYWEEQRVCSQNVQLFKGGESKRQVKG